jgi:SSS family solute:Na+ symporter/sodium/pantothenate symporter
MPSLTAPLFADATAIAPPSPYTLVAFVAYMGGVFLLGFLSHQLLKRGSFLKEYFLGDRQLNAWVLGLTYVATSVSAGSFVGFPSFIYQYGWIMALWIAGYMVAGLVSKGVLAKRLNQVSRISGAITVPDVLRDRFQSPALGTLASICLLVFLLFNLVGQFKAGGLIMRQACLGVQDSAAYQAVRRQTVGGLEATHVWNERTTRDQALDVSILAAGAALGAVPANLDTAPALTVQLVERARTVDAFYGLAYPDYVLGILIFSLTVVAYTTYGGFWAVTWTDVLQGIVIVAGAMLLMVLALVKVGGLTAATTKLRQINPELLTGPGPHAYLLPGLAVSYFFLWTIGAMGQPVGMVRLMACRDTPTLRTSLFMIGFYYALIYFPLVITFICARALYPTQYVGHSDDIMPAMALNVTADWPLLGGLILAAPYAAAMSAVAGFLLLMSSSLVRDIYQRNFNPKVSPRLVRVVSYATTAVVGVIVTLGAFRPPPYLQNLIIFSTSGMACTFLAPTVLALYWRKATRAGALAAMAGGFLTLSLLWLLGAFGVGKEGKTGVSAQTLSAYQPLDLDPLVYGLLISFLLGIVVSRFTQPLPAKDVDRYFLAGGRLV